MAKSMLRRAYAQRVCDHFHRLYYDSGVRLQTTWLGTPVQKLPFDLWVLQESIVGLRPDLIIETGTSAGGSALFYATVMDTVGHGRVVTVDLHDNAARPAHPRVDYLSGSSTDPGIVAEIHRRAADQAVVMVLLDSDHTQAHVQAEIAAYAPLVTVGSLLVVEDTCVSGNPVLPDFGPGPMEAVREFLSTTSEFAPDRELAQRFHITFNPNGYLRRVQSAAGAAA